ncbi:hypothetical protein R70241_01896 [Paraburkholderia saeva]|jgi:hypothetical protein|nr:hypothetical protein R70241_01896 [Paraburkholderia saeva]
MNRRCPVSLAIAVSLVVSYAYEPSAVAQTGAPGTKQMQDAQRKAEQKARGAQKNPDTHASHSSAASAPAASAP